MTLEYVKMKIFFNFIWSTRARESEISGTRLGSEAKTIFFHHVLEKNQYPDLAYCIDNILLVTAEEHQNLNNDLNYYKKAVMIKDLILNNHEKFIEKGKRMEKRIEETLKQKEKWDT
jgi:hypothetical protein